jgi:hypothetical protein
MLQLMQATDIFGMIVWFVMFFVFIFLYPRLMLSQLIYKLDQSASKLESMSERSNLMAAQKVNKNPDKALKTRISEFTDFFVVEPSSIDPYGLVKKVDQTIRQMESRFYDFTEEIAKDKNEVEKQELNYTLRANIGLRQIAKTVRHYVEMAKKFKNLQIAMILQMQLPLIEKIAESEFKGARAFMYSMPVGDSIGPLVASSYMTKPKKIAEEVVMDNVKISGRNCFVLKATGPQPHLGRMDEAIEKIMKKNKIARIVTIDAGAKMEGEKSGSVTEGVGFAMGGIGQRELIENSLLSKKIPIDSVVIKVGLEEAIMPMKKEIFQSLEKARILVERSVSRSKKGQNIIIIGVGNSTGIGDTKKTIPEVKKAVSLIDKQYAIEKKQEKGSWL